MKTIPYIFAVILSVGVCYFTHRSNMVLGHILTGNQNLILQKLDQKWTEKGSDNSARGISSERSLPTLGQLDQLKQKANQAIIEIQTAEALYLKDLARHTQLEINDIPTIIDAFNR